MLQLASIYSKALSLNAYPEWWPFELLQKHANIGDYLYDKEWSLINQKEEGYFILDPIKEQK